MVQTSSCLSSYGKRYAHHDRLYLLKHALTVYQELDRQEIEDLRGKLTGEKRQGEMITLRVVGYEELWREGARDAKTLAAWALYEGLNREGAIKQELDQRKEALSDSSRLDET